MKYSYNWLKWYIPDAPAPDKLESILTYHLFEVESAEKLGDGDVVLDIKILPSRAHDLLSHQGLARELASLLNINYVDPTSKYVIPSSLATNLVKEIKTDKCRRYMGRIIRNVKVGLSPEWVIKHLASIGQRSINNIVDATNIVMFDCGQPTHVFDLNKIKSSVLRVQMASKGQKIALLGGTEKTLDEEMMIIADEDGNALDIAGVKGGKLAELTNDTKDIILEAANFDPVSVRKTAHKLGIFTDAKKRFENDLSPELAPYAMRELSALIAEMCPLAVFEDVVDVYPKKQDEMSLKFRREKIAKILGYDVSDDEVKGILNRYNFTYTQNGDEFEIVVPPHRLDLNIEEDMAEEIARVIGFDKIEPYLKKVNFTPKNNEVYTKIAWVREKLLADGYSEVMTTSFRDKGKVSVLASASDKNYLRSSLLDGLKESVQLNKNNSALLNLKEVKIFEIGTVWNPKEVMMVGWANNKEAKEFTLDEYIAENASPEEHGYFSAEKFLVIAPSRSTVSSKEHFPSFAMWSLFPFIVRDVAVFVPEGVQSSEVEKVIKDNLASNVVRGPELFDEFKKDGKISYAFRLVFQSFERTLTDEEVNEVMTQITNKIKAQNGWQVR